MTPHSIRRLCGIVLLTFAWACITAGRSESVWVGTVDTLESGLVAVTNLATGIWNEETRWRVVEELRIGTLEGNGPDLFGRITDLAVDPVGRMYARTTRWYSRRAAAPVRVGTLPLFDLRSVASHRLLCKA